MCVCAAAGFSWLLQRRKTVIAFMCVMFAAEVALVYHPPSGLEPHLAEVIRRYNATGHPQTISQVPTSASRACGKLPSTSRVSVAPHRRESAATAVGWAPSSYLRSLVALLVCRANSTWRMY